MCGGVGGEVLRGPEGAGFEFGRLVGGVMEVDDGGGVGGFEMHEFAL